MPWTFAHPAAVLPLRRYCPRWLNWPALIIGSVTPDLGYYLHRFDLSHWMHRFPAGLPVCVLAGLMLLAPFYALRRPLCQLLPQPHRATLLGLIPAQAALTLALVLSMMLSLAIGAATHMAWDGLTHRGGWAVMQLLALQEPLFYLWGAGVPAYQALQHLSTFIGVVALTWVYVWWLKREAGRTSLFHYVHYARTHRDERWRYRLIGAMAIVAMIGASFSATLAATPSPGTFLQGRYVFFFVVHSTVAFAALLSASALAYQWRRGRSRRYV